jgi:hypothetical protein
MAIIMMSTVSVIAELQRNLKYLKTRLLNRPPANPIAIDTIPRAMKSPAILIGVKAVKLSVSLNPDTLLNNMILTISLKTPSPYTIENNLGYSGYFTTDSAATMSLEQRRAHIVKTSNQPIDP